MQKEIYKKKKKKEIVVLVKTVRGIKDNYVT